MSMHKRHLEFAGVASSISLYGSLKATFACRYGICCVNTTWQITSGELKSGVPFPDVNVYVLRGRGFCTYFGFLCLFVLALSLSSASLVIFHFYLLCLILKLFRLCVVCVSGFDVSSSFLTQLTQIVLLLASYRTFSYWLVSDCLPGLLIFCSTSTFPYLFLLSLPTCFILFATHFT